MKPYKSDVKKLEPEAEKSYLELQNVQAGKNIRDLPFPPPHFTEEASVSPRKLSPSPGHTGSQSEPQRRSSLLVLQVLPPPLLPLLAVPGGKRA